MLTVAFSHVKLQVIFFTFLLCFYVLPEFSFYNEHICLYVYKNQCSSIWEKEGAGGKQPRPYENTQSNKYHILISHIIATCVL